MSGVKTILVVGAGIAGLAAALAFARRGCAVKVFERVSSFASIGAGIQLSPNATRILRELGVLDHLAPLAVEPDAVVLRRAASLTEIGRVPLGEGAFTRWGAPYLTAHRADLHTALLKAVEATTAIQLNLGISVDNFELDPPRLVTGTLEHSGDLIIAADGVWSTIRAEAGKTGESRFIGQLAWRRTIDRDSDAGRAFTAACPGKVVTAILHPGFHLVAYPLRAGAEINLVAFTHYRKEIGEGWAQTPDIATLRNAMRGAAPVLTKLTEDGVWTAWPIHVADLDGAWIEPRGLALVGDAAHAMTPFAAQGAAMAIEDVWMLAGAVCGAAGLLDDALNGWAIGRRRRVLRVARRGAFNEFAWHAREPMATARDMMVRRRGPERLAADMDWLYGWKAG